MNFPAHNQGVKPVILLFFGIPDQDPAKHTKTKRGSFSVFNQEKTPPRSKKRNIPTLRLRYSKS